jgi:hypothetical protein
MKWINTMNDNYFYEKPKHYGAPAFRIGERVMSIIKDDNGFILEEECDNYFRIECTKEEAIRGLEKAISWIKEVE